jgi:transcriptional regulator with XRE-family HTH domain
MYELEKLIKIMARRGLSQEAVARELGISYRTVARWLSKRTKKPSPLAVIVMRGFIRDNE